MNTLKDRKKVIIDYVVSCLKNGEQRAAILVKVGKKWGTSKSAFDRLLKIAKEQHNNERETINKELAELDIQTAIEARKKTIMTADERKVYLTQIIKGEVKFKRLFVIGGQIMEYPSEPDIMDRLKAIAELNKMEGSYAPSKIATTDTKGNEVKQVMIINGKEIEF
jgi:hypothetical protein